jgi:hypothetical protein
MPTYLFDASALCKRYFVNETVANVVETFIKKRPGPIDALLLACAQGLEADDVVIVSSDVDLNALAQLLGLPSFDPEHPKF